jgi:hypothetical protein
MKLTLSLALRIGRNLFALFGALMAILISAIFLLSGDCLGGLEVSGKVVDAKTGEAVPRAHVIVTYVPCGLMVANRSIGLIADESGMFSLSKRVNVHNSGIQIDASGPGFKGDDLFATMQVRQPNEKDDRLSIDATISVKPVSKQSIDKSQMFRSYDYNNFCPRGVAPQRFEFDAGGWKLPL